MSNEKRYTIHLSIYEVDADGETAQQEDSGVTLDFATTDLSRLETVLSDLFDKGNKIVERDLPSDDRRPEVADDGESFLRRMEQAGGNRFATGLYDTNDLDEFDRQDGDFDVPWGEDEEEDSEDEDRQWGSRFDEDAGDALAAADDEALRAIVRSGTLAGGNNGELFDAPEDEPEVDVTVWPANVYAMSENELTAFLNAAADKHLDEGGDE